MTAQEADRYHGNHAFRLSIEVPQIGHPYETTASLNMTREQILAYNFDRAACRYQPGQDVSACNFKLDYASYECIEAASEPKNPELNKTGIMAARVVTKGAHENRELLAESYRPVAGLEQRNRNDRIRRIDGQVSENLMEETLKFLEMDAGDERRGDRQQIVLSAAGGHVLPDEHAQPVAVIIPAHGLNFDVLAQHIEAQPLHERNIIDQRLVRRRGV